MKRKKKAWCRSSVDADTPSLISPEQAAEYLDLTTRTLANWRSRGYPNLPYIKLGRSIKYRQSDLDTYLAKHSHNAVTASTTNNQK